MTAIKQLIRTSQVEVIELDNPNVSVTKSCELMKKLTVVAMSSIAYLRGIFPDKAFNQRKIDGMPVKVLIGVKEIPGTYKLISWIKSAFEVVKDNYLKKIILVIEKPEDENTLETYTFRFSYNHEAISCSLQSDLTDQKIEMNICPENVKKMAKQMLRTLITYMSVLEPLPSGCELGMRLEFYDNVPEDYVLPSNFKAIDSLGIKFPDDWPDVSMGKVDSKFTTLLVASKSKFYQNLPQEEDERLEENECEEEFILPSQEQCPSLSFPRQPIRDSNNTPSIPQVQVSANPEGSNESSGATRLSEALSKAGLEDKVVKCMCGCIDKSDSNLQCESCSTFQHRACYKVLEEQTVPRHICIDCYENSNDSEIWVHPEIINDKDRKASSLYRRALVLCLGKARISVTLLVNELNIKRQTALNIFNQLGADGCLSSPSGKGFLRSVKTDYLKRNIISKHFTNNNTSDMETEENNPNFTNINNKKRKAPVSVCENEAIQEPVQWQKRKRLAGVDNIPAANY